MKQVFYSEDLDKYFDTKDQCLIAERDFEKQKEEDKLQSETEAKIKETLSSEIENTYREYSRALEEIEDDKKKFKEELKAKIVACDKIKAECWDLLRTYNDKFGVYTFKSDDSGTHRSFFARTKEIPLLKNMFDFDFPWLW